MAELRLDGRPAAGGFAAGPLAPIAERAETARVAGDACGGGAAAAASHRRRARAIGGVAGCGGRRRGRHSGLSGGDARRPRAGRPSIRSAWRRALGRRRLERGAGGANPRIRNGRRCAFPGARDRHRRHPRPRASGVARALPPKPASPRARSCWRATFRRRGFFRPIGAAAARSRSRGGSAFGHVATLARARGVPMIVGLGVDPASLPAGALALVDGERAALWVDPQPATRADFETRARRRRGDDARRGRVSPRARCHQRRRPDRCIDQRRLAR